jgi:hypothetical protein
MARCTECNSVVIRTDSECYVCGEAIPGAKKRSKRGKKEPKPTPLVTPLSNLLFIASVVLTVVSFLSGRKMSLVLSGTLSCILFIARIIADRIAAKQELALRPVTIPRLHY